MQIKSGKFIPAIIKEVKGPDDDGVLSVTVSYFISNDKFGKDTLNFPNRKNRI